MSTIKLFDAWPIILILSVCRLLQDPNLWTNAVMTVRWVRCTNCHLHIALPSIPPLVSVSCHLVGPMQVNSVRGARYYVLFKDVYSKFKTVYFLESKSETANCFLEYTKMLTTNTSHHVKLLRCDGGTEFIDSQMNTILTSLGIKLQTSAPYTPEQNGIAARDHRSTVESARSQIHDKGVPLNLWAEAVNYSVYVLNVIVFSSKVTEQNPF